MQGASHGYTRRGLSLLHDPTTWCMPNFIFRVIAIYLLPMFFFLAIELRSSVKTIVTSTPAKTKRSRKGKKKERKKEVISDEEKEQAEKRSEEDALNWEKQLFQGNTFDIIHQTRKTMFEQISHPRELEIQHVAEYSEVFGNAVKHCLERLIYLLNRN